MLYREIMAGLRSTQNTQMRCGQNTEFLYVEAYNRPAYLSLSFGSHETYFSGTTVF